MLLTGGITKYVRRCRRSVGSRCAALPFGFWDKRRRSESGGRAANEIRWPGRGGVTPPCGANAMAVIKITCPECQSVLRPAKPVPAGKTVKCPECGNRFTVSEDELEAPAQKPKKANTDTAAAGDKPQKPAGKKPVAADDLPIPLQKDDDEEGGTYGFEDPPIETEDKPDIGARTCRSRTCVVRRTPALVRPTNMMILVGGLGFLWSGGGAPPRPDTGADPDRGGRGGHIETAQAGDRAGARAGGRRDKRPAGGDEKRPQPEVHARNLRRQHRGVRPGQAVPGPRGPAADLRRHGLLWLPDVWAVDDPRPGGPRLGHCVVRPADDPPPQLVRLHGLDGAGDQDRRGHGRRRPSSTCS